MPCHVTLTEFTDPGCPFAFSAEPARRRIEWLYGDQLEWSRRMVVLSRSPDDYVARAFTPEKQAAGFRKLQREHRMPIDARVRPRMHATEPACRAVVAARLRAPHAEKALLRRLRVLTMAGHLLDEPATLDRAAREAGLETRALRTWMEAPEVTAALNADAEAARDPSATALVLDDRLAETEHGHRYTCPSYVFGGDCGRFDIPGFRPVEAYEVILANLAPGLDRRADPDTVAEVLEWAGEPLATAEVAAVCKVDHEQAREELAVVADHEPVGSDGYWQPRGSAHLAEPLAA